MSTHKEGSEKSNDLVKNASDEALVTLTGEKSPGVRRMEVIAAHFTRLDRIFVFIGVFFIAYAYGLDGTLRYVYQPVATASYFTHSTLATINVLRGVIAAAAQPTAAKIADVFGRVELILFSVFFYVLGTIVEASSNGVKSFAAGAVFYQIGYTFVILLVEVIIADVTSLRARVFFSYVPALPFLINTWVSGDVGSAVLGATTWRWGVGMWAIIYPVCALPLIIAISVGQWRAKKAGALVSYKTPYQTYGARGLSSALFWQLDVIGIILLIAVFALVLTPFTTAGGTHEKWKSAHVIAPLVIGILCIPVWIIWERRCKYPMVPFHLLRDRAVWSALGIAVMLNTAWYLQGDFLFTQLVVGFDESIKSATRITSLYSFTSVLTGAIAGAVIYYIRRLKWFIVTGTVLFLVAFGLLINFRGGENGSSHSGIIGAQVLLGIAGGLFPYPAQASIQAATKHQHLAVITGLYLASYSVGSALGNTISGAIWQNVLPAQLASNLSNSTLVASAYGDPFTFAATYPVGTPERDAVMTAYRHTQRILCITGICLSVALIFFALCLRNPKLGNEQSLPDAEQRYAKNGPEEVNEKERKEDESITNHNTV